MDCENCKTYDSIIFCDICGKAICEYCAYIDSGVQCKGCVESTVEEIEEI